MTPMRMIARVLAATLVLFASTAVLTAQVATGAYPYSTSDTLGPDTINVGNLNVHLSIPVLNKAGRGMPFTYVLSFDNSVWYPATSNGATVWTPVQGFGWRGITEVATGYVSYQSDTSTYSSGGGRSGTCTITRYFNFQYHDPFGAAHPFPNAGTQRGTGGSCPSIPSDSDITTDGTGFTLNVTNFTRTAISTPSGKSIVVPGTNNGVATATDANGNEISVDGSGHFTDTTGNVALTVAGSPTSTQTFTYTDTNGNPQTLKVNYAQHTVQTDFGCANITDFPATTEYLVSSIVLGDQTSTYTFQYEATPNGSGNVTGRLWKVALPQGNTITYTYPSANGGVNCTDGATSGVTRALSSDSGSSASSWSYTRSDPNGAGTSHTEVKDGLGNYREYDFAAAGNQLGTMAAYYETSRKMYQGAATGTPVLFRATCYNSAGGASPCATTSFSLPITQIDNYETLNGVEMHGATVKYDSYGELTESDYYDYGGSTARGALLSKESLAYGYSLVGVPTSDILYDGSNNVAGQTTYQYDQTTPTPSSGVPQHVSVTGPRGNLTTTTVYPNSSTTYTTTDTYEDTGSLLTTSFGSGTNSFLTTFSYDPTFVYLEGEILPTPSSGVALSQSATYDTSFTGLPLKSIDPNGQPTQVISYDAMLRPTEIQNPDGGYTTFGFSSTQESIYTYQNSSTHSDTEILSDGYGRQSRIAVANGQSTNPWYQKDTCYDANTNVDFTSYSYQGAGWGTSKVCSGSGGDTFTYDVLGRLLTIRHGDGTSASYTYTGRAAKFVDEDGVTRIAQIDGLGRPSIVCEISNGANLKGNSGSPVSCGTDISGTGYVTSYSYALATGTTTVTQGGQTRTFKTDWLGRPTSIAEPETGTASYGYTFNSTGLLVTRTRPKANQTSPSTTTTTTTQYDSVGRVVSIAYSDGTATRNFAYDVASEWGDTLQNPKGHLVNFSRASTGSIFSYDPMGRVVFEGECTPSNCGSGGFNLYATYDWEGNMTQFSDAFGPTYTYTYTQANEQKSITSNWNDSNHPASLLSSAAFGPSGPLSWNLGNGLTGVQSYDSLGRTSGGWLCKGSSQPNCSGSLYSFNSGWTGSYLTSSSDSVEGQSKTYAYDSFGRLASMVAASGNFSWAYDRWGNRWTQTGNGPQPNLSFNTATNQISDTCSSPPVAGHYCYDAAGNMTSDVSHTYTYDPDGNVIQIDAGTTATYTYDALNHRIRTGANSEFIFDPAGRKVSEWDPTNKWEVTGWIYWGDSRLGLYTGGTTEFEHQDWLGTERSRTNVSGTAVGTYSSLPFGDGYSNTGNDLDPYHFATLDQDNTADEHAQFREYSNMAGRWFSPDPYPGTYDPTNPQSFNRYSYALNSPLSFIDPTGLDQYFWADGCLWYSYTTIVSASDGDFQVEVNQTLVTCDTLDTGGPYPPPPGGPGGGGGGGGGEGGSNTVVKTLKCASETANKFSIAGALGLTEGKGIGSTVGTAFLGNTFSGIVDAGTHIYENVHGANNGNAVVADWALGGARQGIPGGGVFSKGIVGISTEAALNGISETASIASPVTGEVTSLAAEGTLGAEGAAGPVGWIKLGVDAAIFVASATYCYNHP